MNAYKNLRIFLLFSLITLTFYSCSSRSSRVRFEKTPVDNIIKQLSDKQNFTIILFDMDYDESSDKYKHQYNILIPDGEQVNSKTTQWFVVSDVFFDANKNNMGMEIASKKNGVVKKTVSPAGYSNYVGNEKYGRWRESNGTSFWEFYGKYAFLSSMFNMAMYPVRYSYYDSYRGYYNRGQAYYGPTNNGRTMYGTNSQYNSSQKSKSWNKKSSSFKSKVNSKVARSSSRTKKSFFSSSRSRSSSRYSRSSTRSRSRGFGK